MNSSEEKPVSGYGVRLEQHRTEFWRFWQLCENETERVDLIKWYFEGDCLGLKREDLLGAVHGEAAVEELLDGSEFAQGTAGKHPPEFRQGDLVEVIVNAKNLTHHVGTVRDAIWHLRDRRWNFYILAGGKKVGKRYLTSDLRRLR